jgi:Zn-dependent M28 family amino/carboxypeptidase
MELARICSTRHPLATMIFAATAGEEQGLYGSNFLAQTLYNASLNVEGNWNNDIVGTGTSAPFSPINNHTIRVFGASAAYPFVSSLNSSEELTSLEIIGEVGGENDSPARNLGRFIAEITAGAAAETDMQVALIYRPDRFDRGGDQESFLSYGFPAVRFTEAVENFAHQHQDPRVQGGVQYGDLVEFVDFGYTSRVAKVNLASMVSDLSEDVCVCLAGFPRKHSQLLWAARESF